VIVVDKTTTKKTIFGRNRGIPKPQWVFASTNIYLTGILTNEQKQQKLELTLA
jgi:hypothetical protein